MHGMGYIFEFFFFFFHGNLILILLFDIIAGGVTTMEPFLKKFFPSVLQKMAHSKPNQYCIFDSQTLTAFTSSLYVSGLLSSLVAGRVTTTTGRRGILLIGGLVFLAGTALNAAAMNIEMLILGRLLLGVGIGFTNQVCKLINLVYFDKYIFKAFVNLNIFIYSSKD
jgi:MFS family permease